MRHDVSPSGAFSTSPAAVDYLISRLRRHPPATLEARAEKRLSSGQSAIPRSGAEGATEYDPNLASLVSERAGDNSPTRAWSARPWVGRRVELRTRRQILLGRNAIIMSGTILNGRSRSRAHGILCGDDFYVKENAYLDAYGGWIQIGRGAALAQETAIHGNGGVTVGNYLMMGRGSMLLAGNHNYSADDRPFLFQGSTSKGIVVGSNVWIGAGVVVLDGVTVGDNVVIGAGTIVARDVPSDSLVVGVRDLSVQHLNWKRRG